MAKNNNIESIIGGLTDLPTLPQVASKIITLVDDPATSTQAINEVVTRDPAMAGKILRLVNSSYYGLMHKVSNLNQGIVILGFNVIRSIALSVSVFEVFKNAKSGNFFDKELFWKHSVCVGAVTRALAHLANLGVEDGTAFSIGLLHGIGKLVLDVCAPEMMQKVLDVATKKKCGFDAAEKELGYPGYPACGAYLAERWQFSREMISAIRDQNDLENAANPRLSAAIQFARYICAVKEVRTSGDFEPAVLNPVVWKTLGLLKTDLPRVLRETNEEIARAATYIDNLVSPK